jgi:hypothetical protein
MLNIREYFLLLPLVLALFACSTHRNGEKAEAVALDTASVINRVNEIYEAVFKEYNAEDSLRNLGELEGSPTWEKREQFNKDYCTRDLNRLFKQIDEIDRLYHSGEMGFIDADYWIMAQDWNELSISDVEVLSLTPIEASVQFNLHNFGDSKPVALRLLMEDGEWKIDDFLDVGADFDMKKSMLEYVKTEMQRNKK